MTKRKPRVRTVEDVLGSAPRGYPRPVHDGLPVPWIANVEDLGDADAFRRAVCVMLRLCQVCGLELGTTATVCWRAGDRAVTDGAAVHPARCWPLALAKCPELRRMFGTGILRFATVLTASLEIEDTRSVGVGEMPRSYRVPVS